jgi:hypothetical protein
LAINGAPFPFCGKAFLCAKPAYYVMPNTLSLRIGLDEQYLHTGSDVYFALKCCVEKIRL